MDRARRAYAIGFLLLSIAILSQLTFTAATGPWTAGAFTVAGAALVLYGVRLDSAP